MNFISFKSECKLRRIVVFNWMNPVQHAHLVVKQARAFFDGWFDKFSTWDDFRRVLENKESPEFGNSADVKQVENWFGGRDCPANYEQCCNAS